MAQQDSRILLKRSTVTTTEPVEGTSSDHTDGTWANNEIYVGELFLNTADDRLFIRTDNGIKELSVGSGQIVKGQATIASAQVQSAYATPVSLETGITGKELICTSAVISIQYGTAAYTGNTTPIIQNTGATVAQMECSAALSATGSVKSIFAPKIGGATGNVVTGAGLEFSVKTGAAATGDSDIVVDYTYIIRDIP